MDWKRLLRSEVMAGCAVWETPGKDKCSPLCSAFIPPPLIRSQLGFLNSVHTLYGSVTPVDIKRILHSVTMDT